ncbi:hypothetical protein [Bartonella sp. B39]
MDILIVLIALVSVVSMAVMGSVGNICDSMAIVAVYYYFIKRLIRARALSKTLKKLKNGVTQLLNGYEREEKEQGSTFDTRAYLSSFKESLVLSQRIIKEYSFSV